MAHLVIIPWLTYGSYRVPRRYYTNDWWKDLGVEPGGVAESVLADDHDWDTYGKFSQSPGNGADMRSPSWNHAPVLNQYEHGAPGFASPYSQWASTRYPATKHPSALYPRESQLRQYEEQRGRRLEGIY